MATPTLSTDFTVVSRCETTTDGGTWVFNSVAQDSELRKEGTYSLYGTMRTTATHYIQLTCTNPIDCSNKHIRWWFLNTSSSLMGTYNDGGCKLTISDGTGSKVWKILGSDTYEGGWKLIIQDAAAQGSGAGGGPIITAIRSFRLDFVWPVSPRNIDNTWVDYLVVGNGYTIMGGTSGDPVTWDSIATADLSAGYGVVQKINGVYFVNGRLTFGHPNTGCYFQDQGETVVFLQEPVSSGLYKIEVRGGKESTTSFILGQSSNTADATLGYNGCNITTAGGCEWTFDAASTGIDILKLYGCNFSNMSGMLLGTETTACGGTGSNISIVDNLYALGKQIRRNIAPNVETIQLRNKAVNWTYDAGLASMILADNLNIDATRWSILNYNGFTSKNDNVVETISITGHDFSNLNRWLYVYNKKTWNLINPIGTINTASQTQLTFSSTTGDSVVNEKYSLDVSLTNEAGSAISNASVWINRSFSELAYSGVSNALGLYNTDVLLNYYTPLGTTGLAKVNYAPFALRIYDYGKIPYLSVLDMDVPVELPIPLLTDPYITETGFATALTNGANVDLLVDIELYGNESYNTLKVMHYVSGVGTLPSYSTPITIGGSVTGEVVEVIGSVAEGTIVIRRAGISFSNEDVLSVTSPTWTAYADLSGKTNSFYEQYTYHVNCNGENLNTVYDYLLARLCVWPLNPSTSDPDYFTYVWMTDVVADAPKIKQILYGSPDGYYTGDVTATASDGVWVSRKGAGTIAYMVSNNNVKYIPPVQYTFTINGLKSGSEVRLFNSVTEQEIAGTESGSTSWSYNYIYPGSDINCYLIVLNMDYQWLRINDLTLTNSNQSIPVQQIRDRNYENLS